MMKKLFVLAFTSLLFIGTAEAQSAEVAVTLNESFFDALLDAVFINLKTPTFPLVENSLKPEIRTLKPIGGIFAFSQSKRLVEDSKFKIQNPFCDESIRLKRAINGARSAIRFRNGRIYALLAFESSYGLPLIGCIDFEGIAETLIELKFDKTNQTLAGRARVLNVKLTGLIGLGSSILTPLVQNSVDRKINPLQILSTDKLGFILPVQNAGGELRMRARDMRWEILNGALTVYIVFDFAKA